jgi:hypothetical protein
MKYKTLFRKLAKSKKGFDDDFTDIIIGIIFIALIFIVVFVYITNTQVRIEEAIEEESNELEKDYVLLNYLRTPMKESKLSIAEYLGFSTEKELEGSMKSDGFCCDKDKPIKGYKCTTDGPLTKEIKEILEGTTNWQVGMLISGKGEFCSITKDVKSQRGGSDVKAVLRDPVKVTIPSKDNNFDIKIYFSKGG